MDKQIRETIRLLVSEARARVIEAQSPKSGARVRTGARSEPRARPSKANPAPPPGSRAASGADRSRALAPNVEVGKYSPYRSHTNVSAAYSYELRRAEEVIATGHITREQAVEVGEQIAIGGMSGIVRTIEPPVGERDARLVVELSREGMDVVQHA